MRLRLLANSVLIFACATTGFAAPPIDLELATEQGVQITAPQQWLQLLADIGIENVRIRRAKPGDVTKISNRGTAERPSYEVVGIITAQNQLQLTGGTFSRADRAKLKDYFDRLTADGAESLTALCGLFGLTANEVEVFFADLAQPIDFETKGQPPRVIIGKLQSKFSSKLTVDLGAQNVVRDAKPIADELKGISAGTGLAMMLRANGLGLRPEKSRGQPVVYYVEVVGAEVANASGGQPVAPIRVESAGKTDDTRMKRWPIGWEPHASPGETAPSLFQMLNAQVDGFTLAETLAAIGPRLKIPMYVDHAAVAAHDMDLSKVQVRLAKTRTSYKRVIDRALAQGRLRSQIRVDEAGNAFLWITR